MLRSAYDFLSKELDSHGGKWGLSGANAETLGGASRSAVTSRRLDFYEAAVARGGNQELSKFAFIFRWLEGYLASPPTRLTPLQNGFLRWRRVALAFPVCLLGGELKPE